MPMTISGDGSITGLSAGGLPDATIITADIVDLNVTPAKLSQKLTSGTAVASTSGTFIDFTGIPSWVKRVTVMFQGVSLSGSSQPRVQLGAGSATTTGYIGTTTQIGATNNAGISSGFDITSAFNVNSNTFTGNFVFTLISSNIWVCSSTIVCPQANQGNLIAGYISLSSTLDRVRTTTVNGTDTFDAGSINILYE